VIVASWLQPDLERHLAPVSAPDELWNRIQRPRPTPQPRRPVLVFAAAALAIAAVWAALPKQVVSDQAEAIQALNREPENLDLRADTVTEIRAWVKSKTGLDLPLPSATSQAVQLTGVCGVKNRTAIAYRVRGHNAALLVSKVSPAFAVDGKHRFLKCESVGGSRVSSWTMRGQLYTLAYASTTDPRDECLLCHAGPQQLPLAN
jgi:hypothetical protein